MDRLTENTDAAPIGGGVSEELEAAKRDIAAVIWMFGCCEYCGFGKKDEYCGAVRWRCSLEPGAGCKPVWRGIEGVAADG